MGGGSSAASSSWKRVELLVLLVYVLLFYVLLIRRSLKLSRDHLHELPGLRRGWMWHRLNDVSDAQWRNFRGNLPILTIVLGIFTLIVNTLRSWFQLRTKGMSIVWLFLSLLYLWHLHEACIIFILLIGTINFLLVKMLVRLKYFIWILWIFNVSILISARIFEGYQFMSLGSCWAFLDNYRGTFRWHICFNFVVLRMISFGCDYCWAIKNPHFDEEKHLLRCPNCQSRKACYHFMQEKPVTGDGYSFPVYLCYLVYAPLYIAGPISSFNAFASQLDVPQTKNSMRQVLWYGFRWIGCLLLIEVLSHFFYYNSFATSGLWRHLSSWDIFIIGYGVLNFMWLKFLLIWRYFRLWSMIGGIETPENMPKCINNCYDLEGFWKSWHASFNKWLVRYVYIPLGGSKRKLVNVWVIFTFVALWHDLEWRLISWAWLTCIFMIPEVIVKSGFRTFQTKNSFGNFIVRELGAVAGAITITCLMVSNLVGYVVGPSNINVLIQRFLKEDGVFVPAGIFTTFYVGTKVMFHIRDYKNTCQLGGQA